MQARVLRVASLVLAAFLLLPLSAPAQTETGSITGVITDQSGAVLPGVTVTVKSPALLGGAQATTSGAGGNYMFRTLPPGSYDLKFELSGFGSVTREGIQITSNFIAKINVTLGMQALAETVTVTGEAPVVDSKSTLVSTSLDKGLLDNIPTGRDIWVLTEQVAGTVPDRYNVGGTESAQQTTLAVHGATGQQDYSINGLSMNWPGGAGNYTMFYFDYDSFAEVQIQTAGASAEVSVGGLYMNMITKSGGDLFHGGITAMYQPGKLQGNNLTPELEAYGLKTANPIDLIVDFQPTFGGPIKKEKAWFFGSYRRYVINQQVLGVTNDDGSPAVDINHQTNVLGKVTAQVTPKNRLMVQYYFNYQNRFYRRDNGYAYTTQQASWRQIEPAHLIQGQWTSPLTKSMFIDARFGYLYQVFPLGYQSNVGNNVSLIDDVKSTVTMAAPYDMKNTATRHQGNVSLSYYNDRMAGTHDFKFGFEWMRAMNGYDYVENGDMVQHYADGVPSYVDAANTTLSQKSVIYNTSFYAQDSWAIRNRLTANLGLRFENFKGTNPAQSSPGGAFFPARSFSEVNNIPNFNIVVPRLGASYDVRGDGRTAIKLSWSRYALQEGSRFPETLNPNAYGGKLMPWTDLNGDNVAQVNELGTPFAYYGGASGVKLDSGISRQYSDETTVGFQHEIGRDIAFSATYFHRSNKNLFGQLNRAIPSSAYTPVQVPVPAPGSGTITVYNLAPEYVGRVDRIITNQTQFWEKYDGIEFTARKRLSQNWQMLFGYTYSKGKSNYVEVPWNFNDANDPNNLINIDGRVLASDTPNIVKLGGTYMFKYGISVSGNWRYYTGKPLTRTVYVTTLNQGPISVPAEPRGTYRYPSVSLIDLRISKVFDLTHGMKLEAMFNMFNMTNASTVINQQTTLGPYYGQPIQILTPIVTGFGGRWTF